MNSISLCHNYTPYFLYSFFWWWTPWLISCFGNCEHCCWKYAVAATFLMQWFCVFVCIFSNLLVGFYLNSISNFLKVMFIYLNGRITEYVGQRGRERPRQIFYPPVHSSNRCNGWGWAMLKPGAVRQKLHLGSHVGLVPQVAV